MMETSKRDVFARVGMGFLCALSTVYSIKAFTFLMPVMALYFVKEQGGFKKLSLQWSSPLVFLLGLLSLGCFGILWAEKTLPAFKVVMTTLVTVGCGVVFLATVQNMREDLFPKIITILKSYFCFSVFFIIIQYYINTQHRMHYFNIKPAGSILGFVFFCIFLYFWTKREKAVAGVFALVSLLLIFATHCLTALLGLFLAMGVFLLSLGRPRLMTKIFLGFSFVTSVISPLLWVYILPPQSLKNISGLGNLITNSLYHRFLSWEYYSQQFFKNPLLGEGPDSSKYIPQGAPLAKGYIGLIHPHNNSIQLYAELGILGGFLYSLMFASFFWLVLRYVKDRLSIAMCNATLIFAFIEAEVTHSVWRNYWISVAFLVFWLAMYLIKYREGRLHAAGDHLSPSPIPSVGWGKQPNLGT